MRITETDIQTAIVKKLKDNGLNAFAGEIDEGFTKPAVFVSADVSELTLLCSGMESVTDTVEISCYPANETKIECNIFAEKIRNILAYKALEVNGRYLTIENMRFYREKYVQMVEFDLTYEQICPDDGENYDKMESLVLGL